MSAFTKAAALRHAALRPTLSHQGRAAFHKTNPRALLPAGPQVIQGGVNDPAFVPAPDPAHGSYHWTFERLLSAGLVPLFLAPFAAGSLNPTMDAVLCGGILVHAHMGLGTVVTDYVPKRTYPRGRKVANWGLNLVTLMVGAGLYEFETNDVGVTETIKRVWQA